MYTCNFARTNTIPMITLCENRTKIQRKKENEVEFPMVKEESIQVLFKWMIMGINSLHWLYLKEGCNSSI